MDRPRFSQALVQRRRELGLSTAQASRVLKLKEPVLIALEEGDFESIPKSGYAQGMVSSYARYLGLDAREMVDLFTEDLERYEAGQGRGKKRKNQSLSAQYLRRPAAVDDSRRNLLPTSGGRAGDMGDFATTSQATTRTSSVPLVSAAQVRSSLDSRDAYSSYDLRDSSYGYARRDDYSQYGARDSYSSYDAYDGYGQTGGYGAYDGYADYGYEDDYRAPRATSAQSRNSYGSSAYATRSSFDDGYDDDYGTGYESGYSQGRSAARGQQSQRRRQGSSQRSRQGSGQRSRTGSQASRNRSRRQSSGSLEDLLAFASESRLLIGAVAAVVAIILLVVIFMGVQSCTKSRTEDIQSGVPVSTTVTNTTSGTIDETSSTTEDASTQADTNTTTDVTGEGTAAGASSQEGTATQGESAEPINAEGTSSSEPQGEMISTEVVVSVASGESTWLEVMADGESRIADQVLGPWSDTYVVKESLTVQADDTSAVSVFENGEVRTFENHASGVGSITINVPQSSVEAEADTTVSE